MGLEKLRERFLPEELVGSLGYLAGLLDRPEAVRPHELVPAFSWEKVPMEDIYLPSDLFDRSSRS